MASSTAEPRDSFLRTLAAWALPWLFSTTAHALLLVALALLVWGHHFRSAGSSSGGMQVEFTRSESGEGFGGDDPVGTDFSSGGNSDHERDVILPPAQATGEAHLGGGGAAPIDPPVLDKPSMNLTGLRTAGGDGSGTGGGEGDSVGPATGTTTSPTATGRLRGGYARTGVFGAIGEGRKFVYVFDRSGSMDGHGGAPLSAAKRELIASLKDLGEVHQFQIIFYNEQPRVFNPTGVAGRLVFGTDQNKYLAQKFIGSITADGATRHEEALVMALRMSPDVIFFLTDADEPRMTTDQLSRIERLNHGTSINAIEFGYGPRFDDDNFLVRLARQNGGKHVYVDVSKLPRGRR